MADSVVLTVLRLPRTGGWSHRVRLVPCRTTGCSGVDGAAMLPNGEPYVCGRAPDFPFFVKCFRCKRTTKLSAADWNRLPHLTVAQLEDMKLLDRYTKDYEGAGVTKEQAKQLLPMWTGPSALEADWPAREVS